jgi:capsular polysaccharide transport system permease protein
VTEQQKRRNKNLKAVDGDSLADDDDLQIPSKPQKVRPVAGPTRMRKRHLIVVFSFFLFVVAPMAGLTWYMYTLAVDQFASNFAFEVRTEEAAAPAADILGFNVSDSSSTDAEIVNEFIASQQLVAQINEVLDLKTMYSKPPDDILFRFDPDGSIEDLLSYWLRMVDVSLDGDKGLLQVRVLAFDPQDAQNVALEILKQSAEMINRLSAVAQEDATRYARGELDRAVDRLKDARQALTAYRSENQIIDPEAVVAAQMGLLNSLQQQLADTLIEADLLRDVTRSNDPRIAQSQRKIEVIEARIAIERQKIGSTEEGAGLAVTDIVGRFEELRVDLEFAETTYLKALSAFEASIEKARRKSRYLATFVEPTLAERSEYPRRETVLAIAGLFLFLIWAVVALVLYSIRDRR